ncbi:MAG: cysteine desulfurase family protein, partial [Thermodesulfobacteriota bacterium]
SNNMVFHSCTKNSNEVRRIVTTKVEHSSILKMCSHLKINGVKIETVEVDEKGLLIVEDLEKILNQKKASLVSIQWINNETGAIQDIESISKLCKEKETIFHTDAAQAAGKLEINIDKLPVDFLSFTGHKYNAPQGCGVLYAKDRFLLNPILFGGFQEEGFRPGTENLPGIVGIGKASEIRLENLRKLKMKMKELRDRFEAMVLDFIPGTKVNGSTKNRVCNTTNIRFGNLDGRRLIQLLDKRGIRCSQSSACTNFDSTPSYVLLAMGLSEKEAYSSIRFSFSPENTFEEINRAVDIIKDCCESLSKF